MAAYYGVSEALTNAAEHASATVVDVEVSTAGGVLKVRVLDDGRGGARPHLGSGLVGQRDRVEALGGHLRLSSPPNGGTTLEAELPWGRNARSPAEGQVQGRRRVRRRARSRQEPAS